jgi:hypothetical protein
MEGAALTVGKYPERDCFTTARAARKFAYAATTLWFEMAAWSSSVSNSGSWNIFHHPCDSFGVSSLKDAGVWISGFTYTGAKLHPVNKIANAHAQAINRVVVFGKCMNLISLSPEDIEGLDFKDLAHPDVT